jgi:hypothetical protein
MKGNGQVLQENELSKVYPSEIGTEWQKRILAEGIAQEIATCKGRFLLFFESFVWCEPINLFCF